MGTGNDNILNKEDAAPQEIQKCINEQKSGNKMKKTKSNMNTFRRYLDSMKKKNVEIES